MLKEAFFSDMSVVVPAYNAAMTLRPCVEGLVAAGCLADQIIVVDDASTDDTRLIARSLGVTVLENTRNLGPAESRNRAVAQAQTALILCVDADVVVHPNGPRLLLERFNDATVAAVFGSYDAAPSAPALVSRYRNLLHHYVHQAAPAEAETFWCGFGAFRRSKFEAVGGFDRAWENLEDVEFGLRLRAAGSRIVSERQALATHLKAWTLGSMFRTDLFGRSAPWTRLLGLGRMPRLALNGGLDHRLSAILVAMALASAALAPVWPPVLWGLPVAALGFVGINARFLVFLYRVGGLPLAIGSLPFHAAHYLAGLSGYILGTFRPQAKARTSIPKSGPSRG